MAKDTTQQTSFSHSDPRVQAAMTFTQGDEDKARKMASGEYHDVMVIKGKFTLEKTGVYGNYMIFANTEKSAFVNISVISYTDPSPYEEINPAVSWKEYYKACERIAGMVTITDTSDLIPHLTASLAGYDIFSDFAAGDEANATQTMNDIMNKYLSSNSVSNKLSFEATSSLDLFEERIPMVEVKAKAPSSSSSSAADNRPEIEKQFTFVVEAKAIVSPLKGKRVADLVKGDQIILLLVNRDGASLKIAEALGAFDENRNYKPIKGKFLDKIPVEKIGYYLYCALAKNAVAKIPEEGNVQIETADGVSRMTIDDVEEKKKSIDRNLMVYVAMLLGLVIIAAIIIYVLV
jgi:hypothetical protein